ncbi:hypothetical protein [Niabella ginsengisoli]|uniref:FAD-dependent oxidoreductase n=1 Tax=Niabella ginsengisoli TaxID=522298 RepID=A0ABS9SNG1_9BACT|nr:hypothetical protein [Niabella ginsengisoli]MCH5599689.1 hypothetical protein [Niabella ginsengisoli]
MDKTKLSNAKMFDRDITLKQLSEQEVWDILVIGGGATGLGVALDAVSRGIKPY